MSVPAPEQAAPSSVGRAAAEPAGHPEELRCRARAARRRPRRPARPGHRPGRRQRCRQEHPDQGHRRHPRLRRGRVRVRGQAGQGARPEGRERTSASRSSTRTSRCATTSTSSTTCSSAASSGRQLRLDDNAMEQRARETLDGLSVRTLKSVRTHVAVALRWPAPDRRDRPRGAVELQGRHPRRADRRPRRRADRAGPPAGAPARRPRPRRRADQPQPQRRLRGRRRHRRALPRPARRPGAARRGHPRRGGRADHHRRRPRSTADPDEADETSDEHHRGARPASRASRATPSAASSAPTSPRSAAATSARCPAVLGLVVLVIVFSILRPDTFTTALNFANLIDQSAGVMVLAMGLVFVLLLGEIDLSAGFTGGTAAAAMCIVITQPRLAGWLPSILVGLADRYGHRLRHRHCWSRRSASRRSSSRWRCSSPSRA